MMTAGTGGTWQVNNHCGRSSCVLVSLRMWLLVVAALALAELATPTIVRAQVQRADSALVLLEAARFFDNQEENEVAAALYELILEHYPDTPAATEARGRLSTFSTQLLERSGATEIRVWSSLYGLFLGVTVPIAMDLTESEAFGAGLLVGGPLGFLTGRAVTKRRPYTMGQARALTWGGTWGAWQGLGWARSFSSGEQATAISMISGSALGIFTGSLFARREIAEGTAESASLGSMWGSYFGASLAFIAKEEPGDGVWTSMMLTGNAGLIGGALAGRHWKFSRSRARLISVAGIVGMAAGMGVVMIAQPNSSQVAFTIPMTTSIVGLAVGAAATRSSGADDDVPTEGTASSGEPSFGALFNWSGGQMSLGTPLPAPVFFQGAKDAGRRSQAWRIPLARIHF